MGKGQAKRELGKESGGEREKDRGKDRKERGKRWEKDRQTGKEKVQ